MRGTALRTTTSTPVKLNVYDLHVANEFVAAIGLGLYHSGVEIDGREYVFGSGSGIADVAPRSAPNAIFRASIPMGSFDGGSREVARAVDELRSTFPESGYDLVSRNCNHFADALVFELLRKHIPAWVNRAAMFGSCIACLVPRDRDPTSIEDGRPTSWTPNAPTATFRSFEGQGYQLVAPSTPTQRRDRNEDHEASLSAKRAQIRNAALRRFDCSPD